jgi:hypothetical protein
MRPALPVALAFGLGVAASCYSEEFLLGAYCAAQEDCGDDQCCTRHRCRPRSGGNHCREGAESSRPYEWAYMACATDDECLVHGMPRCVLWKGTDTGFCADLCSVEPTNCAIHPSSFNRTCVDVDGQQTCALACGTADLCPAEMRCHEGLCVPAPE